MGHHFLADLFYQNMQGKQSSGLFIAPLNSNHYWKAGRDQKKNPKIWWNNFFLANWWPV